MHPLNNTAMSDIDSYIANLNKQYATGKAHEHSYRSALQNLLNAMLPGYTIVNEPTRETCGAPDFIILKNDTPIAYLETKDLQDTDLDGKKEHKEQFDRYRASLDHIIFTDYLSTSTSTKTANMSMPSVWQISVAERLYFWKNPPTNSCN